MAGNGSALTTASDPREAALLQAIGFDRLSPAQRELGLAISNKYDLDPMLKHIVLIEGRAYITRDGLLHIAHRSGKLDGIETTEPAIVDGFWRAACSVYRKDMSRPFTYTGRYPTTGGNQKYAPEMAVKVAEVMALRRAFDVAAPTAEERWDVTAEPPAESQSATALSLAERAAAKRAAIENDDAANADAARGGVEAEPTAEPSAPTTPTPREAASEPADAPEVASDGTEGTAEVLSDVSSPAPTGPSDGKPIGRLLFMDELNTRGIPLADASAKADEMFPGVEPKSLTDAQRGTLLEALTF